MKVAGGTPRLRVMERFVVTGGAHLVGEVGDVFLGKLPGRAGPDDVTVFESLGIAVEDLASAHHLLKHARETGAGQWLEWGGPAQVAR